MNSGRLFSFIALSVIGTVGIRLMQQGGSAHTPPMFAEEIRLDEAMDMAEAEGKVVFALATADWCAPCQQYKRTTLVDARVEDWVRANAIAVYVDVDDYPEEAQLLKVGSIPATYIIRGDRIEKEFVGGVRASALLGELSSFAR